MVPAYSYGKTRITFEAARSYHVEWRDPRFEQPEQQIHTATVSSSETGSDFTRKRPPRRCGFPQA
jgi:hypothetical protein